MKKTGQSSRAHYSNLTSYKKEVEKKKKQIRKEKYKNIKEDVIVS